MAKDLLTLIAAAIVTYSVYTAGWINGAAATVKAYAKVEMENAEKKGNE